MLTPIVQIFGGVWAVIPDLPIAINAYPSLGLNRLFDTAEAYQAFSTYGDIFFFHSSIDRSGEGKFLEGFAVCAAIFCSWILLFVFREIRRVRAAAAVDHAASPSHSVFLQN